MATYAIGDVQGCYEPLMQLLNKINFNSNNDTLWFTGDLVNRGPDSLQVLRFIKNLSSKQIVLGNHDLHLLAVVHGAHPGLNEDTVKPILDASDRHELIEWLQQQPLIHHDEKLGYTMVHAGLSPEWDLAIAKKLSHEVESVLQSPHASNYLHAMYGDQPDQWNNALQGNDRLRCITNYFTRARLCHPDGRLELKSKGKINANVSHLIPWFKLPQRINTNLKILFGHWAALGGETHTPNTYALDTGCVWGFCLTAMRLEDGKKFSANCPAFQKIS